MGKKAKASAGKAAAKAQKKAKAVQKTAAKTGKKKQKEKVEEEDEEDLMQTLEEFRRWVSVYVVRILYASGLGSLRRHSLVPGPAIAWCYFDLRSNCSVSPVYSEVQLIPLLILQKMGRGSQSLGRDRRGTTESKSERHFDPLSRQYQPLAVRRGILRWGQMVRPFRTIVRFR